MAIKHSEIKYLEVAQFWVCDSCRGPSMPSAEGAPHPHHGCMPLTLSERERMEQGSGGLFWSKTNCVQFLLRDRLPLGVTSAKTGSERCEGWWLFSLHAYSGLTCRGGMLHTLLVLTAEGIDCPVILFRGTLKNQIMSSNLFSSSVFTGCLSLSCKVLEGYEPTLRHSSSHWLAQLIHKKML